MRTMASVLLDRETVEGDAVNALLDDKWDAYLAAHPEEASAGEKDAAPSVEAPARGDAAGAADPADTNVNAADAQAPAQSEES